MVDPLDVLVGHGVDVQQGHFVGHIGILDALTVAHMDGLAIAKGSLAQFRCEELLLDRIVNHPHYNLFIDGQTNRYTNVWNLLDEI